MALVTLEQVKHHLRVTTNDEDADLEMKLAQAEAIVLRHIARPLDLVWTAEIAAWTELTAPLAVQAAIMRQCANLHRYRGDDSTKDRDWASERDGFLSADVRVLLVPYRDPVIA